MGSLGFPELMLVLLIVIIVFGAGRLGQLGRGLGEGISNFRESIRGGKPDDDKKLEEKKNS